MPKKSDEQVRDRAVRLVLKHQEEYPTLTADCQENASAVTRNSTEAGLAALQEGLATVRSQRLEVSPCLPGDPQQPKQHIRPAH